jgi:hypothetical protein
LVTVDGLFLDLATLTFAATVLSPTFPNLGLHFGEAPTGSTRTVSTTSSSDSGCGSGSGSDRSSSSANGSSSSGSGSSGNNSGTNNGSCAVVPSAPDPTFFLRLGERIGEGALWTVFAAEVVPINTQSQTQHASRNRNGPSPASPRTLPVVAKLTRASMHVEGLEWCETFARAEANLYAGPLGALGTVVPTFYGMWSAPLSGHDCMPVQQQMHQVQMQQGQDMDVVVCTSGAEDGPGIHDLPRDNPGHDPEDDCPALDPHLREDHSRGAGTGARNSNTLDACSYADSDAHDVLLVAVFERVGRPVARSWAEVPRDSR